MGSITSRPSPQPPPRRWKKVLVEENGKVVAKIVLEQHDRDPKPK